MRDSVLVQALLLFCFVDYTFARSQLAGGGYYCNVLCLAGQLESGQGRDLAAVKEQCKKYDRNDSCNADSANCKKDCAGLKIGSGSSPSAAPTNVRANYSTEPESNPYVVSVQWERVPSSSLYIIEYFHFGEKGDKDAGKVLGHEVSSPVAGSDIPVEKEATGTKASVKRDKKSLCVRYGFRVAAVNKNGVGPFSDDVILDKPTPVYKTKPTYQLKSLVYTNKEFEMDAFGEATTDPNSVEATVGYALPPNWQPTDFTSPNEYVHNLMCKHASPSSFTTRSNMSADKAELVIPFPGKNVDSDCTYLYTLLGLNTICDTTVPFPDPSDSNGTSTSALGIFVNISCSAVTNSPCKATNETKQPSCAIRDFDYKVTSRSDQTASVTLTWGDVLNPKSWPVQYYVVKYSLSEKPNTDLVLVLPLVKSVGTAKTCSGSGTCDGNTKTVTINNLDLGNYFVAQICAVYDPSLESSIPWDTTARYPMDLTSNGSVSASSNASTSSVLPSAATTGSPTALTTFAPTTAFSASSPSADLTGVVSSITTEKSTTTAGGNGARSNRGYFIALAILTSLVFSGLRQ